MSNTFEVANLIWYVGRRPFWEVSQYLAKAESDLHLAQIAINILAISTKDGKHFDLTPSQARTVISRLNPVQLISFEVEFDKVFKTLSSTPFIFDIPEALPEPHWKVKARPKLSKEKEELLQKLMVEAQQELQDKELLKERVIENFERFSKKTEVEASKEPTEPTYELAAPLTTDNKTPEKEFALNHVVTYLHPLITQNIYTLFGSKDGVPLTLRYVNRRETLALKHLYAVPVDREKAFCAMSIASIDNEWCLSSTQPHPKAMEFVNSWSDVDVIHFYEILLKIRIFIESLLPYIEALPFIKIFRDFWTVNQPRGAWWKQEYSSIPGISSIPPCEHIDLFTQECILEDQVSARIESEDTLALQIAGVANELAQSIQEKVRELIRARGLQINYMLFNELPVVEENPDGSFLVPTESTREELLNVAENELSGKMDYHNLMIELLRKRRDCFEDYYKSEVASKTQETTTVSQVDDDDAYQGGSSTASEQSLRALRERTDSERAFWREANLEFSLESVGNIAKQRKRAQLIKGLDPYHDTDQSIDLGPAKRIIRN